MRRRLEPRDEEAAGELNVVPYLDILLNLILFMLLSLTGLVSLGAAPPASGAESPVRLSVSIERDGFADDHSSRT